MLKLDTKNLGKINSKHGLSEEEMNVYSSHLIGYLENIKKLDQGFYDVVDDEESIRKIEEYVSEVEDKFDSIVVLGIGGSALGTICMYQSLKHTFENELDDRKTPKLYVVDNVDPVLIKAVEDVIDYKKTLFIVVSKSGGTPETISQYLYFKRQVESKHLDEKDHFVFITDSSEGLLRRLANENNIKAFDVPKNIGGRFSVLTSVGLLPAALVGIDIRRVLVGAREGREQFLSDNFDTNISFRLALSQYLLTKKGKNISVLFPYTQHLTRLADWYRQLLAESIGKKIDRKGNVIHAGITPVPALGATDQHSQLQLYQEGPNDKFFIFIDVVDRGEEVLISNEAPKEVEFLSGVSFNQLIAAEQEAIIEALTSEDHPSVTIQLEKCTPETLGSLFMFFEGSIAFLGELFDIDAFNQPGVEMAKKLTREKLSK